MRRRRLPVAAAALALVAGCKTRLGDLGADASVATAGCLADASCAPTGADAAPACFSASPTPWQYHDGPGPTCLSMTFATHGGMEEYAFAAIPAADDAGWQNIAAPTVEENRRSRLCAAGCTCGGGLDFDYWQTFVDVPDGVVITRLTLAIRSVDDGARATVFNDAHPDGAVADGSYAFLGKGSVTDLAPLLAPGANRIVLTHVDDCCQSSILSGGRVTVDGQTPPCP